MPRTKTGVAVEYQIEIAAGSVDVNPALHHVHVGDTIRWSVTDGSGRITFQDERIVEFQQAVASPGTPAEAIARRMGTHYHTIAIWRDQRAPGTSMAILIVDP